ncbi:hypothetical protein ASE04_09750 [Rhizobium sp. Root708]|nr:hypothetical protein ASE04_09750 [Rhizobium sp. Root708]
MTPRTSDQPEEIQRAAQWLADRNHRGGAPTMLSPILPTLKARFGLTDADAAEAILLAGNYSVCRRAFG